MDSPLPRQIQCRPYGPRPPSGEYGKGVTARSSVPLTKKLRHRALFVERAISGLQADD